MTTPTSVKHPLRPKIIDDRTLRNIVLSLTFARLIINMGRRFPYAVLPGIARQLGVPLSATQSVLAIQAGTGVTSPLFGSLSERYGRKRVILGMLAFMTSTSLLGLISPIYQIFAVVMIAFGISKMIFDPAVQAYVGDRVPYRRRGTAMGIIELSWAGSLLIAAPLTGVLLGLSTVTVPESLLDGSIRFIPAFPFQPTGLQAVFGLFFILSIIAFIVVWRGIPDDKPAKDATLNIITPLDTLQLLRKNPAAIGAILSALMLSIANEIFFINYGVWMEQSFGLTLAALGAVTIVIASAEIGGEVAVIALADRIGKKRMAMAGLLFSSLSYLMLPFLDFSLLLALIMLFIMFISVEIAIVASIPLFSEVMPDARAVMMSGVIGATSGGRLLGAVIGSLIFSLLGNFVFMGIVAFLIGAGAFIMLWRFVPES